MEFLESGGIQSEVMEIPDYTIVRRACPFEAGVIDVPTRREFLRYSGIAGLAATGGLFAASGRQPFSAAAAVSTASGGTQPITGGTLTIMIPEDMTTFNPFKAGDVPSQIGITNLFDTLVYYDPQNHLMGRIAVSWDASADGKTFTYHIREDMKFHDGTPVDAHAVKRNIDWIMNPANKSLLRAQRYTELDHWDAPDDSTVVLQLRDPQLPTNFVAWSPYIESPAAFAQSDLHPVGSGPFMFDSYVADSHIRLTRFDDYWAGKPYLDSVEVRMIVDPATQTHELLAGTIDVATMVNLDDIGELTSNGVQIVHGSGPHVQMLSLNLDNPLLADLAVRKAIAYAINKPAIVQKVLAGYADVATTLVSPIAAGFDRNIRGYAYDPAKAKQTLSSADWVAGSDGIVAKDGKPLELTMATQNAPSSVLISQIIQQELKQVGINVQIQQTDWPTFLNDMRSGKYDIAYWSLAFPSLSSTFYADNFLSTRYWNVSQMSKNPAMRPLAKQFDDIVTAAESTLDDSKRYAVMEQFQKLIVDQLPVIPLWHTQNVMAVQPWVHGLVLSTSFPSLVRTEKAWKSKK